MELATSEHSEFLEASNAPKGLMELAASDKLFVRNAPFMASTRKEFVAKFSDVEHLVENLDGAWYSGVMPWSLAIRCATVGVPSHGGLLFSEDQRAKLIDTCEFKGCRKSLFAEKVAASHGQHWWKGQWYWGPMDRHYRYKISRTIGGADHTGAHVAIEAAMKAVGAPYGHLAIVGTALWQMPFIREFQFFRYYKDIECEKNWVKKSPYCSMFQSGILQKAGIDPVPGKALQLTTPQDTFQSLLWPIKIALVE